MEDLEKVETVREKCNVSYECAKEALDASDGNVLDAIIWLERQGRTQTHTAHFETEAQSTEANSPEMLAAQEAYQKSSEHSEVHNALHALWRSLKAVFRKSVDTKFVATRRDETIINIPLLVPIVGLLIWGSTIWLLIIGLFFGLRYSIKSADSVSGSINNVMDRAADAADSLKKDIKQHD